MKPVPPVDKQHFDDPLYSQRNPHQAFLLLFSLISASSLMSGTSGSAVMDARLSQFTVHTWGLCLFLGSLVALTGEFWSGHTWTALVLERAGLGLVGTGAALYALIVVTSVPDARFAAAVTAAYAASCWWRVGQITRRLHWLRALIKELNSDNVCEP